AALAKSGLRAPKVASSGLDAVNQKSPVSWGLGSAAGPRLVLTATEAHRSELDFLRFPVARLGDLPVWSAPVGAAERFLACQSVPEISDELPSLPLLMPMSPRSPVALETLSKTNKLARKKKRRRMGERVSLRMR
ncbi:unnamed protein product, partial [Polarella glacialis]